jgi:hypothetical protein
MSLSTRSTALAPRQIAQSSFLLKSGAEARALQVALVMSLMMALAAEAQELGDSPPSLTSIQQQWVDSHPQQMV